VKGVGLALSLFVLHVFVDMGVYIILGDVEFLYWKYIFMEEFEAISVTGVVILSLAFVSAYATRNIKNTFISVLITFIITYLLSYPITVLVVHGVDAHAIFDQFVEMIAIDVLDWRGAQMLEILFISTAVIRFVRRDRNGIRGAASSVGDGETEAVPHRISPTEPGRLAAAHYLLANMAVREHLLEALRDPLQARPQSLGLDYGLLARIAIKRNAQDWVHIGALTALVAVCGALLTVNPQAPIVIGILIAIVLNYWKNYRLQYGEASRLSPTNFGSVDFEQSLPELPEQYHAGLPRDDDNVVIYTGQDPFADFGLPFGRWALAVDLKRGSKNADGSRSKPSSVSTTGIMADLASSLGALSEYGFQIGEKAFVDGVNIPEQIKPRATVTRPAQHIAAEKFSEIEVSSDGLLRQYLHLATRTWGGQIWISYFVRTGLVGNDLHLEIHGRVVPPIGRTNRDIDKIPPNTWQNNMSLVLRATFVGPLMALVAPIMAFSKLQSTIASAFRDPVRVKIATVEQQAFHDYGAPRALRTTLANYNDMSFFQLMDRNFYELALTGKILRSFTDYLDIHGVDTSGIVDQQSIILNHGIIVQGGGVSANNLAVGKGATMNLGNVAGSLRAKVMGSGS
jgi:hypothetical protein